jgi:hypothetical protein
VGSLSEVINIVSIIYLTNSNVKISYCLAKLRFLNCLSAAALERAHYVFVEHQRADMRHYFIRVERDLRHLFKLVLIFGVFLYHLKEGLVMITVGMLVHSL